MFFFGDRYCHSPVFRLNYQNMAAMFYLLLGFIPPLVAGPLAGVAYIEILKRREPGYQIPFWALLFGLNLLVMVWVAGSSGTWLPISSLTAFIGTPVASILTVFVMRHFWRRLEATHGVDGGRTRWYNLGRVLIPALQLGVFAAFIICAPWLCKVGLVMCKDL
jgi:hypothetical protein